MRQLSSGVMENIARERLVCWVVNNIVTAFSHLQRAQRATAKSIAKSPDPRNERNQEHNNAHDIGMWLKIKPEQYRRHKNDCGLLHAVQIRTRIPFCREFSDFLVPFGALCFGVLYHFLEHNRHSTRETAPLQHYEEKNL